MWRYQVRERVRAVRSAEWVSRFARRLPVVGSLVAERLEHFHRARFEAEMPLFLKNTGASLWLQRVT
jgi:hypothetical protein